MHHFSRLSEPYNPLQGFSLKVILFREICIFRFLIYMGLCSLQHMISSFPRLLLRMQDHTFPKTPHIRISTTVYARAILLCVVCDLQKMHNSMLQVGSTRKNNNFYLFINYNDSNSPKMLGMSLEREFRLGGICK